MIIGIPAREARGLDAAFEPDFGRATNIVVYDTETDIARDSPVDPAQDMANVDVPLEIVLCCKVESGVWQQYINRNVSFLGVDAATAGEALEKYRRGDLRLVNVSGQPPLDQPRFSQGPGHVLQPTHQHCGWQAGGNPGGGEDRPGRT